MENTMRSGRLIRLYARADSRPLNAANGEMLDSYAERYRSRASPEDVELDIWIVDGFGLVEYADAEEAVGPARLYVDTYLVFS
jgi:hypothetical protein